MTARPVQTEKNEYETGARKYVAAAPHMDETDTHAGMPTANPFGLTQPEDETSEKTRRSDNVDQRKGASPETAAHSKSKSTKAAKGGRQPGAYVKH